MKKIIILSLFLILYGCKTDAVPVAHKFPEIPEELKVACPDLRQTENTEKLSRVLEVVVDNYSKYHECQAKVDAWIEWYEKQSKNFNEVYK